jgi:protein-disulfide isomerase
MASLVEPISSFDHVLGRIGAPVTLVEYGDYECPYCRKMRAKVERIVRHVANDICFAFRNFPLGESHPNARAAAAAAEAAAAQGAFWEMQTLLFRNQTRLGEVDFAELAAALHLDVERFRDDLESDSVRERIRHDFSTGLHSGVNGTPTFFLGDARFERWNYDDELFIATVAAATESTVNA